ncbi:hypothetical protein FRC03_009600 [Tulasnella sp. 419]|nr:hypothetical protein FRC02_010710 [Tulasnella sp. 418]KAG8970327.1 hypothetical protein FRC03_009600 [Tulasnella sp. 419]
MPLYEILCISSHSRDFNVIRGLVKQTAMTVMNNGGVVRSLNSWGSHVLPSRARRHKQYHTIGDYWTIHFDASPPLMQTVANQLQQDPRVVRWTTTKIGERLEDILGTKESTVMLKAQRGP